MFDSLTLMVLLVGGAYMTEASSSWSYVGANGPENWPGICTTGQKQSPINIVTDDVVMTNYSSLKFVRYDFAFAANVTNTGHTIQVAPIGVPLYVNGGGLPSTYILEQMHFHWNSEHTIDGTRSALELHLVHYDQQYSNVTEASEYDNGVAVVAVLFDLDDEDNENLNAILLATESVSAWVGGSTVALQTTLIPSLLLPSNYSTFYRYEGSLTTPECQEAVIWTVLTEKLTVSASQIAVFQNVQSSNGSLNYNFRPLQDIGTRTVYSNLDYSSSVKSLTPRFSFIISNILLALLFANMLEYK